MTTGGDGGSEGSDSEDEIVNVDEPDDEMETETVPLTQAERLAENLRTQNCKSKYKYDTKMTKTHVTVKFKHFSTRKENKL